MLWPSPHRGVLGIAQFAFKAVAWEQAVIFQVVNDRFHGIALLQCPFEPPRVNAPFLPSKSIRHGWSGKYASVSPPALRRRKFWYRW